MKKSITILFLLGFLLFSTGTYLYSQFTSAVEKPVKKNYEQAPAAIPVSISIPRAGVESTVATGGIKNNKWILADNKVMILSTSGKIKEGYNTVMYAHNTKNLFANLKSIRKNDSIYLYDSEDNLYQYQVFSIQNVKGDDIKSIISEIPNTLTLFTCDGLIDEKRVVVKAKM